MKFLFTILALHAFSSLVLAAEKIEIKRREKVVVEAKEILNLILDEMKTETAKLQAKLKAQAEEVKTSKEKLKLLEEQYTIDKKDCDQTSSLGGKLKCNSEVDKKFVSEREILESAVSNLDKLDFEIAREYSYLRSRILQNYAKRVRGLYLIDGLLLHGVSLIPDNFRDLIYKPYSDLYSKEDKNIHILEVEIEDLDEANLKSTLVMHTKFSDGYWARDNDPNFRHDLIRIEVGISNQRVANLQDHGFVVYSQLACLIGKNDFSNLIPAELKNDFMRFECEIAPDEAKILDFSSLWKK